MKPSRFSATALGAGATLLALTAAPAVQAQQLTIGSPNVAVADVVVPRPPTEPCVVTLYTNEQFPSTLTNPPVWDGSNHPFTFTPPANCPGPWEKVVYSADFSVNPGVQYDRTVHVWLGGSMIYFGTTQEPTTAAPMTWHVERDLTDYSALFTKAQTGAIQLGNWYDPNGALDAGALTGVYRASARLYFYPGGRGNQGERPDEVLPLQQNGSVASLWTATDQLAATLTFPTNVERAFLDVFTQSQNSTEEFWFFNLADPTAAAEINFAAPESPFKEALVTIDGQPAGIAPIYPWIYTGGGDPLLWRPTPGVQTLSFQPYRVDLTPFVGVLDDGAPHTIAININGQPAANAPGYFATAGSLLLYLDHGSSHVTGEVTENTLQAAPVVSTVDDVVASRPVSTPIGPESDLNGTVSVTSNRQFTITGTAHTSQGTVTTRIDTSIAFSNVQTVSVVAATFAETQDAVQDTKIDRTTTRTTGNGPAMVVHEARDYPLTFDYAVPGNQFTGPFDLDTHVDQEFKDRIDVGTGSAMKTAQLDNHKIADATRHPYPTVGSPTDGSQSYTYSDPFGACYSRTITSQRDSESNPAVLTSVTDGIGCPGGANSLDWHDQFADFASRESGATVKLLP